MRKKKTINEEHSELKRIKEARDLLWRKGNLTWKLEPCQKSLYDFFHNSKGKVTVWSASRRLGKSHTLLVIAIEYCIKNPGCVVKYVGPEKGMVRDIVTQVIPGIVEDAPPDVMPTYKANLVRYVFPNGSEIQMAGTDNKNYFKLRGGASQLCIVDEAGFCNDLSIVVNSILIPTTLTTGGKIILSSTPPESIDHEFSYFIEKAEAEGQHILKTIYDVANDGKHLAKPRITHQIIEDIAKEYPGGRNNVTFLREYLCKQVTDSKLAVVPEFTPEAKEDIVVEWPKPAYFDSYVSMDIGGRDLTAILFAYYDFKNAVLVIEDEYSNSGNQITTQQLVDNIRKKENEIFKSPISGEYIKPKIRVADNNNIILLNDMMITHGLNFVATKKDNKQAAINTLRMDIQNRKIIINPRCKTLIRHLENAIWSRSKDEFQRSADNSHYDFLDSLIYLVRNVQKNTNPYPAHFGIKNPQDMFYRPTVQNPVYNEFTKLLNPLKKRKS